MALLSVAPKLVQPSIDQVNHLTSFLSRGSTLIITGAGLSTGSGIPDYRSPSGSYSKGHKPVTHQEFIQSERTRKRYWARSVFGIRYFNRALPNSSHKAISLLGSLRNIEGNPLLSGIITQNVDRLHHQAGSSNVLELHGNGHEVRCLKCSKKSSREEYTEQLAQENRHFVEEINLRFPNLDQRADGDAELDANQVDFSNFEIINCTSCGGTVMPNLVFFGGSVPLDVKDEATKLVEDSAQMLILGSTVHTFSAFRLIKQAKLEQKEVGIINLGETRADAVADWKIDCSLEAILAETAGKLSKLSD